MPTTLPAGSPLGLGLAISVEPRVSLVLASGGRSTVREATPAGKLRVTPTRPGEARRRRLVRPDS
jgi:hypothetical protein